MQGTAGDLNRVIPIARDFRVSIILLDWSTEMGDILGPSENILSGLMKLTFNQNVAFSKVSVVFQIENIIIVFRVESYHC